MLGTMRKRSAETVRIRIMWLVNIQILDKRATTEVIELNNVVILIIAS